MKVRDLIEQLQDCNENATVFLAYQPRYPMCVKSGANIVESDCRDRVYIGEAAGYGNEYLPEGISENLF